MDCVGVVYGPNIGFFNARERISMRVVGGYIISWYANCNCSSEELVSGSLAVSRSCAHSKALGK